MTSLFVCLFVTSVIVIDDEGAVDVCVGPTPVEVVTALLLLMTVDLLLKDHEDVGLVPWPTEVVLSECVTTDMG